MAPGRKTNGAYRRLANLRRKTRDVVAKYIEQLSPRKKKPRLAEDKENETSNMEPESLPEQINRSRRVAVTELHQNIVDSSIRPAISNIPGTDVFVLGIHPPTPTSAPQIHTEKYCLRDVPDPRKRRHCVTVEEVPDEDGSVRHLAPDTAEEIPQLPPPYPRVPPNTPEKPRFCYPVDSEGYSRLKPTQEQAAAALRDLKVVIQGESRGKGGGYKDPKFDPWTRHRLEGMQIFLQFYTNRRSFTYNNWAATSLQTAVALGRGVYCARVIRKLVRAYIADRKVLPINPYGEWNDSMLADDGLAQDLGIYLQELGKNITAQKIVEFLAKDDFKEKHGITKGISLTTATRYLHSMGYRFAQPKKGQYADGHEREDVVSYRQNKYIPTMMELSARMQHWTKDNVPEPCNIVGRRVIVWFHDESIFYAHDRRRKHWYHKDVSATPYQKGDGPSLMVADYVSADFGWLTSLDGKRSARKIIRPGKNRDGYFTHEDIEAQAHLAMDIVSEAYPDFEHVFVYDNASTHLKRANGSRSARYMPKTVAATVGKRERVNFLVEVTKTHPETRKPMYNPDGSLEKVKIKMEGGFLPDGSPQSFYYSEDHPQYPGLFKGMENILHERGFPDAHKLKTECKGFKCQPGATNCCCRRLLYTQPDFVNVPSLLEKCFESRGFRVIFLPKFHCELNFIEQCWGYAKRLYRLNPVSSREDYLEKYAVEALESVPLASMRRFANRTHRFVNAYNRGLSGSVAAWACKKQPGHRVISEKILEEVEKMTEE